MTAGRQDRGNDDTAFFGHPKGLGYLAFTEAWERFSFYGMQTMLILYMVGGLFQPGHVEHVLGLATLRSLLEGVGGTLSTQALASLVFGLYSGFAYFLPVFGGLLGDRYVGQHRMVMAGAILMAIGHFLMAFEAPFLIALLLLIVGSGCLKGNISTQVGGLYAPGDRRRVDAFQIFVIGITGGVVLAPLVCGTLGEVYGWHYGFAAAGVGMLIGLGIYIAGRRYLPPDRVVRQVRTARPPLDRTEWKRIGALLFVLLIVTLYLIPGGQSGIIYPLWIKAHIDRHVGGMTLPITWFQSFTAIASVATPPLLMRFWHWQAARGGEPDELGKLAIGCSCSAAAYLVLTAIAWAAPAEPLSWLWLIPHHILYSCGYLFVWPVGLALFSRAAPPGVAAMFIGIYFLSVFIANNVAGILGSQYEHMTPVAFWGLNSAIVGSGLVLVLVFARPLRVILRTPRPPESQT